MQILWRRRGSRVVDLKLPNDVRERRNVVFLTVLFKYLKCFLRKVFSQFFRAKNGRGSNKKWAWRQYKSLSPFHSSVIFVVFHPFYLPLVAAVNQNLKVILLKKEST